MRIKYKVANTVADLGFFLGWGSPTPKVGLLTYYLAENCMKMKEFGPRGGVHPWRPSLGSANEIMAMFTSRDFTAGTKVTFSEARSNDHLSY